MFAVIKTGGKQYKVQSGDMLRVEKLAADAGEKVQFNEVLMLGGDKPVVGAPLVDGAAVQAEVVDQVKGKTRSSTSSSVAGSTARSGLLATASN